MIDKKQSTTEVEHKPKTNMWAGFKFVKPIVALAILANAVVVVILFYYLKQIGWVELLQVSIVSEKGLTLVLMFLLLSIGTVAVVFYSPSYFLFFSTNLFNNAKDVPKPLYVYIFLMHAFWLVLLSLMLWGGSLKDEQSHSVLHEFPIWLVNHIGWMIGFFLGLGGMLSVFLHRRRLRRADRQGGYVKRNYFLNAIFGFSVAFSSIVSTLIVVVALEIQGARLPEDTSWYVMLPMLALTLPGMFIGAVLLSSYQKTGDINKALSAAGVSAIVFFMIPFFVFPRFTLFPLSMTVLRAVSVYSTELATFQLIDVKQRAVYEDVDFKFRDKQVASDQGMYFDGYVRYRFADVLLLCSTTFDPLKEHSKEEIQELRQGCILTLNDEVRRVRLTQKPSTGEN